ncbi:MAG: 3-phosphoshikimate 1-carboxyvinyltransferase [Bacteroidota bacterium]
MTKIKLVKNRDVRECIIQLPSSKSIANRVLLIQQLCKESFKIKNLSTAADTQVLVEALKGNSSTIDIQDAGTACRFMCAYLATQGGEYTLTGTARMQQRPIKPLVDALNSIGANITYLDKEGYLPLSFKNTQIIGGTIQIDASMSSQFVSALLLIAPTLKNGLTIQFKNAVSMDYIEMTLELLKYFGIDLVATEQSISIAPQAYKAQNISIESDWSSASYFFSIAAMIPNSRIQLNNLTVYSLQGDVVCSYIATQLGAETHLLGDNIAVRQQDISIDHFEYDFKDCPDLVMTFAVLCALKKIKARFKNIDHLAYKESNRLLALQSELAKINCAFYASDEAWIIEPTAFDTNQTIEINTYDDHRMAMAFAPLAFISKAVVFDHVEVVKKSFPDYWNQVAKCGLEIQLI